MRLFLITISFLVSSCATAEDRATNPWRTFQNDYGYEFRYPECWTVKNGDPYDEGEDPKGWSSTYAVETKKCRKDFNEAETNPRSISIDSGGPTDSKTTTAKLSINERYLKSQLERKEWLFYKRIQVDGGGEAVLHVEVFSREKSRARWKMHLFCPKREFWVTFYSADAKNKEILEKLKNGDLAVPDPEKTIFESIRCIDPKLK